MRELYLIAEESTDSTLVLSTVPNNRSAGTKADTFTEATSPADSGETAESSAAQAEQFGQHFRVKVTPELRSLISPKAASQPEEPTDKKTTTEDPSADQPANAEESPEQESESEHPVSPITGRPRLASSPPHSGERKTRETDPGLSAPLTMRPREIQNRIRGGSTAAELAKEMGVAEKRVEVFAYPVMQERARVAELAKRSHPVREDGPAALTLWEILATAFAARGHNLADSSWDAYRDTAGSWVARVTWSAGKSDNIAEWTLQDHRSSSSTAVARNPIAADLIDPDFTQPVRSLTSIDRGERYTELLDEDPEAADVPPGNPDNQYSDGPDHEPSTDLLRHPDDQDATEKQPARRRRKAVTPHWEDVLLTVRTNTKRPKK